MTAASTNELLEAAYKELAYAGSEEFLDSTADVDALGESDSIEKGDWLKLAKEVKAEKVFFINNNPVAVFARHDSDDITALRKLYNNIWCMARPRLLFLAKPGELAVYDLACKPSQTDKEWKKIKALDTAENAEQVASKLKKFHREQLESGRLFEDSEIRFGNIKNRADKALIRDLKVVRQELMDNGLKDSKLKYAHALIGRSIFIRYLEERDILIPDYFYDVAKGNSGWKKLLDEESNYSGLDCSETVSLYPKVLNNKDFTFALFRKLAEDFNGDMFPNIEQEEKVIKEIHLGLIQELLYGNTGTQKNLFFYAYQFKIIPIELISSIYEEFYHKEAESKSKTKEKQPKANPQGAFYTPSALVEFLLSQVLTPERLLTNPRILDPACGSGIFLVESFRRIVRYRSFKQKRRLSFNELRKILKDQLAGIDIEPEAIRIAAFSLYLALLHYLEPPSIREQIKMGNRLPNLVFDEENSKKDNYYNTLLAANAFNNELIESHSVLKKCFLSDCADIVIGNPPWGTPNSKDKEACKVNKVALNWCKANNKPIGQKERSQAFIWKALAALKPTGVSALLVHINVFLMHHDNSKDFRNAWFSEACLHSVYNFSHTRKVFFKGAIAPFAAIVFCPKKAKQKKCQVEYWSSKDTKTVEKLQSVVFRRDDLKILRVDQDLTDHRTWKLYWWGNHHDDNLVKYIGTNPSLKVLSPDGLHGRGFEVSSRTYDSEWLCKYREMPTTEILRYGTLDLNKLKDIPKKVKDRGVKVAYKGQRILVKRGIEQKGVPKGRIVATMANEDFAFRNSVYGIKLLSNTEWEYKCILGILWSSLAKYYLLLTSYDWGVWHDEIRFNDELLELPICLPPKGALRKSIIRIVDKLRTYDPVVKVDDMFQTQGVPLEEIETKRRILESQLDDAIFKLYGLGEAEIDLIRNMCDTNLEYYYSPDKSTASKPILSAPLKKNYGTIKKLPDGIGGYLKTFIKSWSPYLDKDTQLHWCIHLPPNTDSMIAVVFSIHPKTAKPGDAETVNRDSWDLVLERLDSSMTHHFGSSRIYIEGLVRAITETEDEILIIKRNKNRLWTKSMAREDAEATLVQAMNRKSAREMDVYK